MFFAYNASALGAGGIIERGPVTYTIPSLASVALAPTGGEGRSVVANYVSQELSFSHAETRVYGRQTGRGVDAQFTTSTYVFMKDVNIFGRITVAEMGSTVTSTRGFEGGDDHPFHIDIFYRDVRIDGKRVHPRLDAHLASLSRYDDLAKALVPSRKGGPDTRGALANRFDATPDELARLVAERKPVQGSLVGAIEGLDPAPRSPVIPVPGLGTVRFAELMLKPGRRRLNLIRVNFGLPQREGAMPIAFSLRNQDGPPGESLDDAPTGGSMTLGSGEGNGTPIEP
ncbi:MAG TPA: hypothetical protein VF432_18400 [Thermoanaerobaculia bacterium]